MRPQNAPSASPPDPGFASFLAIVIEKFGAQFGTRTASKVSGVSSSRLEKLRAAGIGPPYTRQGSKCLYRADRLLEWASQDRA